MSENMDWRKLLRRVEHYWGTNDWNVSAKKKQAQAIRILVSPSWKRQDQCDLVVFRRIVLMHRPVTRAGFRCETRKSCLSLTCCLIDRAAHPWNDRSHEAVIRNTFLSFSFKPTHLA